MLLLLENCTVSTQCRASDEMGGMQGIMIQPFVATTLNNLMTTMVDDGHDDNYDDDDYDDDGEDG